MEKIQNYKLNNCELRQLQMIELELLNEFDRICRKHNIHYNIIAGTLLGAVRHQGFIPWDDDADVALLREEYEKFATACRNDLDSSRFYFQEYRNTAGYRWGYGKLRRKNTLFLRKGQEHMPYEQGIFIDVFPLDGVPDNYFFRCMKSFECFCMRKILWARVGKMNEANVLKRQIYRLADKIPEQATFRHYERMIEQSRRKKTKYVRILMFPTPDRTFGYCREWYENSKDIEFEGKIFSGIRQYDEYLRFKFGDYWKLPPDEQRKVHPISSFKALEVDRNEKNISDNSGV